MDKETKKQFEKLSKQISGVKQDLHKEISGAKADLQGQITGIKNFLYKEMPTKEEMDKRFETMPTKENFNLLQTSVDASSLCRS